MIRLTSGTTVCRCSNVVMGLAKLTLLVLALLGLGGLSVLFASEGKPPQAEVILDKYTEVTGGKAAYDKITNRVGKATLEIVAQGIKMSMKIYAEKPNKVYSLIESEALGKIEKGTNGKVVWEKSVMVGPQIKEGKERAAFLRDSTFDKLVYWREVYEKAECVGVENVAGKPCYKIIMTSKESKPQTYYFDQKSNLLVKIESILESPMGNIPIDAYVSDYKKVDGILIAHKLRMKVMGQERVITTTSIEHNVKMRSDRFKLPDDIQALVEKN